MKKKLFKGFVTLVVVTILSISMNFASADQGSNVKTDIQSSVVSPNEVDPCGGSLCWKWCSLQFMSFCQLRCLDVILICPQMTWPE